MNSGMDTLLKEVKSQTDEKIKEIFSNAEERATEVIENAREEAEKRAKRISKPEVIKLRRRLIDKAEIEGRHAIVNAKNEILEKIREKAKEKLRTVVEGQNPNYNYEEILYHLIREATENMSARKLYISANSRDANYLNDHITEIEKRLEDTREISLTVSEDTLDCMGGVVLENKKGNKTFYNTLEGRLTHYFNQLKPRLNRLLFTEKEGKT